MLNRIDVELRDTEVRGLFTENPHSLTLRQVQDVSLEIEEYGAAKLSSKDRLQVFECHNS